MLYILDLVVNPEVRGKRKRDDKVKRETAFLQTAILSKSLIDFPIDLTILSLISRPEKSARPGTFLNIRDIYLKNPENFSAKLSFEIWYTRTSQLVWVAN